MRSGEALAERYLALVLAGKGPEAVQTVIDPLLKGDLDLVSMYEDVLARAAERIGELWHTSQISVADEHFATQLTQQVISTAVALSPSPPASGRVVVLACPPEELHDTGLRMLAHVLSAAGHDVHVLGASTPIRALVEYVQKVGATHVGLSIASALSLPALLRAVEGVRKTGARVFIGGRAPIRYQSIAAAAGVTACANALQTLALLES